MRTNTDARIVTQPRIIRVEYRRGAGLVVDAEHACGHQSRSTFPYAPKRSSRQQIRGWLFGSAHALHYGICARCTREAVGVAS